MNQEWIDWMHKDLEKGCLKDDIIKTLKENKFKDEDINKQIELFYIKKNKLSILDHYYKFTEKLRNSFFIKKYKSEKINLYLTTDYLSDDTISQLSEDSSNIISHIDNKIRKFIDIPIYESNEFELIKDETDKVYIIDDKILTWTSILIIKDTILEFNNIKKKFKLKSGTILFWSNFNKNGTINININYKVSENVLCKKFFKLI